MLKEDEVLVRIGSHRALHKLKGLLGYHPQCYYSFFQPGKNWAAIPRERLEEARSIKGITKSKWSDDIRPCIKWS